MGTITYGNHKDKWMGLIHIWQFWHDGTLMFINQNFDLIQCNWHMSEMLFNQDGHFDGHISVLNYMTWIWSCMNIIHSSPLIHVAAFWIFGSRQPPDDQFHPLPILRHVLMDLIHSGHSHDYALQCWEDPIWLRYGQFRTLTRWIFPTVISQ